MKARESIPSVGRESGFVNVYPHPKTLSTRFFTKQGLLASANPRMRLLAVAFDTIVVGILMMLFVLMVYGQTWLIYHPLDENFYISLLIVPVVYFIGFWFVFGTTLGKFLLGLRVVDSNTGQLPDLLQCIIRFIGYMLVALSLGIGAVGIFKRDKPYGWHDKLAGTKVVKQ